MDQHCFNSSLVIFRLEAILMQEGKLYLVFEFLSMDLKKYLDSIPNEQMMDSKLLKVSSYNSMMCKLIL